jgi:hypothetical protein
MMEINISQFNYEKEVASIFTKNKFEFVPNEKLKPAYS